MIKITVEEIEIQVTASVEEALKEFKKILPNLKEQVKQMQTSINTIDMNQIASKTQMAVKQVKQKMNEIKGNNVTSALEKQFTNASASVEKYQNELDKTKNKLAEVYAKMDEKQSNTWNKFTPDGLSLSNPQVEKAVGPVVNEALSKDKSYQNLINQETKLNQKVDELNAKLQEAKNNYNSIGAQIQQTQSKQNIFSGMTEKLKSAFSGSNNQLKSVKNNFNKLPDITSKVSANIKQMGAGMKVGLKQVLRYAGALVSIRSMYNLLRASANSWLSSQNEGAKQLSANIDYMKYAMGSALAPVIQFVTNLMYNLLKAVQSVVYALFKVNIFAKASSKSYASMAGSASKAKKETKALAGIHDEINNVQKNDDSDSGGSGTPAPSFDLSKLDSSLIDFIDSLKSKLEPLFEPIVNSWNKYGKNVIDSMLYSLNSVWELIKTIGLSFEEVWLNGAGEHTIDDLLLGLSSIFNIIGNISNAFKEAWQNSGGTEIIQNLWDSLNNILDIFLGIFQTFEEFTASSSFQTYANSIIEIFNTLSYWIKLITDKIKEIWENSGKDTFTKLLNFCSKFVEAISVILKVLTPIVEYILNIVTPIINGIIETIGYLIDALSGILDFIIGVFTGDWERAWNGIKEFLTGIWMAMMTWIETVIYEIKAIIQTVINVIGTIWSTVWNGIKTVASNIWNGIKTVISNTINVIKTVISTVLDKIKSTWEKIWTGLKTTVVNIWNGIWSAIKGVINKILGGIEGFANGIVRGINTVLGALDGVVSAVGSVIGIDISVPKLSEISLPRLAKGNVAYDETLAVFGEYSNASSNPEITAPQNIMAETFRSVLSEFNGNAQSIELTVNVGNEKLGKILLDDLKSIRRKTGKDIEAIVGG